MLLSAERFKQRKWYNEHVLGDLSKRVMMSLPIGRYELSDACGYKYSLFKFKSQVDGKTCYRIVCDKNYIFFVEHCDFNNDEHYDQDELAKAKKVYLSSLMTCGGISMHSDTGPNIRNLRFVKNGSFKYIDNIARGVR